jgi:hypothetical protein
MQIAGVPFTATGTELTPGSVYEFCVIASNSAGEALSDVKTFNTHPVASGLYVATNGVNTAGTNWSTAYKDPQTAFDIAEPGDIVYLAGQTITNCPPFNQTDIWTLAGKSNVTVIGGYQAASDAVLPGPNDPAQWPTRLRRTATYMDLARIFRLNSVTNCTISSITFQDGRAADTVSASAMGVYINNSPGLIMSRCIITNIVMSIYRCDGVGMYVTASSVLLTNSLVGATSGHNGSNGNANYGAGLFLASGSMTIADTIFSNCVNGSQNGGTTWGGAIYVSAGASLTLRRSVLIRNRADNTTGIGNGGGLCNVGTAVLQNCLIATNGGTGKYGDAIYSSGSLTVENCTIARNTANGIWKSAGTATIQNSILWGNGDDLTGTMSVAYSDVQTADSFWTNGVDGCIQADPRFADTTYYHEASRIGHYVGGYFSGGSWAAVVSNDSPCIDAGNPASDFSLEPSPKGLRINMGAYGNTEVASKTLKPVGTFFNTY